MHLVTNHLPIAHSCGEQVVASRGMQQPVPLRRYLIEITCGHCGTPIHSFETMDAPEHIEQGTAQTAAFAAIMPCTCGHSDHKGTWYAEPTEH